MGLLDSITGAVATVGNVVTEGLSLGQSAKAQKENLKFAKEQQEYNRRLQERMFVREDSAMQRRAADLEKAGFNKLLAAGGSGADSGPVVKSEAPMMEPYRIPRFGDEVTRGVNTALSVMRQKEDIARTSADRRLVEAQISKVEADELDVLARTTAQTMQNAYWEKAGAVPNASNIVKEVGGAWKVAQDVFNYIKEKIEEKKKFRISHQEMPYDYKPEADKARMKYIK